MQAIKVSPALYRFEGVNWTWVKLEELAEIVGLSPRKCWETYFWLTNCGHGTQVFLYAFWPTETQFPNPEIRGMFTLSDEEAKTAYVPAGWATDVLKEIAKEEEEICKALENGALNFNALLNKISITRENLPKVIERLIKKGKIVRNELKETWELAS